MDLESFLEITASLVGEQDELEFNAEKITVNQAPLHRHRLERQSYEY